MSPLPHGLPKGYKLRIEECEEYCVPALFSKLEASDWVDVDKLVGAFWREEGQTTKTGREIKGELLRALGTIASKRKDWVAISGFCKQARGYLKNKPPSAFLQVWELMAAKESALGKGKIVGAKIAELGAKEFGDEIDDLLRGADDDKENKDPMASSSTSSTSNTNGTKNNAMPQQPQPQQPQPRPQPQPQQPQPRPQPQPQQPQPRPQPQPQPQSLLDRYLAMQERDGVDFQGSTVGTIIKRKALRLFGQWKAGLALSDQELHWMACGLSSILDLTHTGLAQQFLDCSKNDLDLVTRPLLEKICHRGHRLPLVVDQTFEIMTSLIGKVNGAAQAREYVNSVKTSCMEAKGLLHVLSTVIDIVDSSALLLDERNIKRVTETDFVSQVWLPLIKSLVSVHGVLRPKQGESCPSHGLVGRKRSYGETCVGFRVDLRLLFDSHGSEHDLLALEAARDGGPHKLCADVCRLMREAKDNLDNALQHIVEDKLRSPPSSAYIQTNGPCANIGFVHLVKPGLYVAVHVGKVRFPKSLIGIEDFKNDLALLMSVIFDLEKIALSIRQSLAMVRCRRDSGMERQVDPDMILLANQYVDMVRPTFYDPPNKSSSLATIPSCLFGSVIDDDDQDPTTMSLPSTPTPAHDSQGNEPDQFGWLQLQDGQFIHIHTGITAERHPLRDVPDNEKRHDG